MKNKTMILVAAALATGLIAAGCGGDDDNDSTTTAALTKAEFIAKADAICKAGDAEINAAPQPKSQKQAEAFISNTVVPGIQKQVDQIRALGAPSGEEAQITAFLDSAQQGIDTVKADPASIASRKGSDPFAETEQKAKALGLDVCAQG